MLKKSKSRLKENKCGICLSFANIPLVRSIVSDRNEILILFCIFTHEIVQLGGRPDGSGGEEECAKEETDGD